MKSTAMLKIATSALIVGATVVGCSTAGHAGVGSAATARAERVAVKAAEKARGAIVAKKFEAAIQFAENAVAYAPRVADYRALLGQAYLGAGRFASAQTAFADALTLNPDNGRAALNLALVEVALGKKDQARSTLADYRERLAAADYGLALALAGDTKEAVRVLELLVREPGSGARTRQNLALAYALDGQWGPAKTTASVDLAPADADARILQWAAFARPDGARLQVASLLGVRPTESDAGMPARLALVPVPGVRTAGAPVATTPDVVPEARVAAAPVETPAPVATVAVTPAPVPAPVVDTPPPVFEVASVPAPVAKAKPVANPAPAPLIRAAARPAKQVVAAVAAKPRAAAPVAAPRPVEAGKFVVQLGAFENAAVSRDAWNRMAPRFGLKAYSPANASARVGNANFVRLSVGGFTSRDEAKLVCTRIQAAGGKCFVRSLLGDTLASWAKGAPVQRFAKAAPRAKAKPVRVASR